MNFFGYSIRLFTTAPGDYRSLNTVVSIPAGNTQHFVEFPIGVDYDVENTESFEIVLSNPSRGAILAQTIATINIVDVDSKFCYSYLHVPNCLVKSMYYKCTEQ
jgi:hypothetical protein